MAKLTKQELNAMTKEEAIERLVQISRKITEEKRIIKEIELQMLAEPAKGHG